MLNLPRWMQWLGLVFVIGTVGGWLIATFGVLLLLALALWAFVAGYVVLRSGWAPAIAYLARLQNLRAAISSPAAPAPASNPTTGNPSQAPAAPKLDPKIAFATGLGNIEALHGLEQVRGQLQDIFDIYRPAAASAPSVRRGTFIVLQGSRGTGKTTVADNIALLLYGRGLTAKPQPLMFADFQAKAISPSDWYDTFLKIGQDMLGGVIVFKNAEWLAQDHSAAAVGTALSSVAERHPYQLTVVATGGSGLGERLSQSPTLRSAWSRFGQRIVNFPVLGPEAAGSIMRDLAKSYGLRFDATAFQRLASHVDYLRNTPDFENAVTVHSLFEDAREAAEKRAVAGGTTPSEIKLADAEAAIERHL